MTKFVSPNEPMAFDDLEARFGAETAYVILRTLEEFEGISFVHVAGLTPEDRLKNVFAVMRENLRYQTRH